MTLPPFTFNETITGTTPFVVVAGTRTLAAVRYVLAPFAIGLPPRFLDPGTEMKAFAEAANSVSCITFAPDGRTFIAGGEDGSVAEFRAWHLERDWSRLRYRAGEPDSQAAAINFLPDGREVITVLSNTVRVGEAYRENGRLKTDVRLRHFTNGFSPHTFSNGRGIFGTALTPDGKYLFTVTAGDVDTGSRFGWHTNAITMWRVTDGRPVAAITEDVPDTWAIAISPNGRYLAYGRGDGLVTLAYLPLVVEEFTLSQGRVTLRWYGGSGLYQVQRRKDPDKGKWHDVGKPTTATTFTDKVPGKDKFQFYRVQSLPNP